MRPSDGSRRSTILLLNDTSEEANWGCRATSRALRDLLASAHPHAEVRPVSCRPLHHAPGPVRRLLNAHAASVLVGDPPPTARGRLLEHWVHRQLFNQIDLDGVERVVLNGEGTTHGFRGQTLRVLLPLHLARSRRGLWTAAVNQTVSAEGEAARALFRRVYGRACYLAVREPRSQRELRDLGLSHAQLAADAAFHLEPAPEAEVDAALREHGLDDGFIALSGSATVESYRLDAHLELARRLQKTYQRPLAFFAATNADRRRVAALAREVPLATLPSSLSPALVAGLLTRASFFIAGRFHLLIFATLAGTPFVPLASNSFKIEGLLESLEYPVPVSGPEDPVERILEGAAWVVRDRDALSDQLRGFIPLMRERAHRNVQFPD